MRYYKEKVMVDALVAMLVVVIIRDKDPKDNQRKIRQKIKLTRTQQIPESKYVINVKKKAILRSTVNYLQKIKTQYFVLTVMSVVMINTHV